MQRRRAVFLINKQFQLRFATYVCLWLAAMSFVYPLILYNLFNFFIRYMASDPSGPVLEDLYRIRSELLLILVGMEAAFLGLTFLVSLFMSHRIAGPLYKLQKFLEVLKQGDFRGELSFRKKDYFQEVAGYYNESIQSLRQIGVAQRGDLGEAIAALERVLPNSGDGRRGIEDALEKLRRAQSRFTVE